MWDSGNVTAGDRIIFYVNGVRETSFSTENNPAQDKNSAINGPNLHELGAKYGSYDISGCMSHVQFVDGLALAPTEFGEVDSTSGIWKIKTGCYATPGNNGFCLKMEDSSNLDLDSSSNANTFATTGTLTATKDNPSNNFATWNPIGRYHADTGSLSQGNNTYSISNYSYNVKSTLAMPGGKWYWEGKGDNTHLRMGVCTANATNNLDTDSASFIWGGSGNGGGHIGLSGASTSWGMTNNDTSQNTFSYTTAISAGDGDIIMVAVDVDSGKMYMGVNGTWFNSSDPAAGTGEVMTMTNSSPDPFVVIASFGTSSARVYKINFGNGYFGTDAVASANADDAGIGAFEYDVPTGFYALCTKNLKLQGG